MAAYPRRLASFVPADGGDRTNAGRSQPGVSAIPQTSRLPRGSYATLLSDPVFLRYALSQAFVLGGLLVFVFGAPAVLVRSLGGTISDFIMMQVIGIPSFILAANLAGTFATKFGAERMIFVGTALASVGAVPMLAYALAGGRSALAVTALFVPVNIGLACEGRRVAGWPLSVWRIGHAVLYALPKQTSETP